MVKAQVSPDHPPVILPVNLTLTGSLLMPRRAGKPAAAPSHVRTHYLTLNETFDELGYLIQYLGTDDAVNPGLFGRT